jgi:hypothetical protein
LPMEKRFMFPFTTFSGAMEEQTKSLAQSPT